MGDITYYEGFHYATLSTNKKKDIKKVGRLSFHLPLLPIAYFPGSQWWCEKKKK